MINIIARLIIKHFGTINLVGSLFFKKMKPKLQLDRKNGSLQKMFFEDVMTSIVRSSPAFACTNILVFLLEY